MNNTEIVYANRNRSGSKVTLASHKSCNFASQSLSARNDSNAINIGQSSLTHKTNVATHTENNDSDFVHVDHETNAEEIQEQNRYIQTVDRSIQYYRIQQTAEITIKIAAKILQSLDK